VLSLFLVATLVPSAAMVWLGWQLLEQDRRLERQRTQDVLESTAQDVAASLAQALDSLDRDLASLVERTPSLRSDTAVAVARRPSRPDQALATYDALAEITTATIDGGPADLLARWARMRLLDSLGHQRRADSEAAALAGDLARGRWAIDRATYAMYAADAARLARDDSRPAQLVLTAAVASAAADWLATPRQQGPTRGRRSLRIAGTPVLLVWRDEGDRLLLFAASRPYLDEAWKHLWPEAGITVALTDDGGNVVVGRVAPGTSTPPIVKPSSDTRLPWTLRVGAAAPLEHVTSAGATRRQLLVVGLLWLVFLISSTGYLVGRTLHRDLAIVRQQADFVSAVSREFRSPLTSIAHLTSLLRGEFPVTEERRDSTTTCSPVTRIVCDGS
jgi:hypothetical protein